MIDIHEAQTNLSEISKLLETKQEDYVIISKNGKPILKVMLADNYCRDDLIGCAKNKFEIPNNFDDIDISKDFNPDIFPM